MGNLVMGTAAETGKVLISSKSQDKAKGSEGGTIDWQQAKSEFFALLEDTEKEALDPDRLESQAEDVAGKAEDEAKAAMYVSIALILGMIVAALGTYMGVRSLREEYKDPLGDAYYNKNI